MIDRQTRHASTAPSPARDVVVYALPVGDASDRALLSGFEALREAPLPWLLDSALRAGGLGQYSFAGADPHGTLRAYGRDVHVEQRRATLGLEGAPTGRFEADPIELAAMMMTPRRARLTGPGAEGAAGLPFVGGAVGFLGYELVDQIEGPICSPGHDLGWPDLLMLFVDRLVALDHRRGHAFALGLGHSSEADLAGLHAREAAEEIAALWAGGLARSPDHGGEASRAGEVVADAASRRSLIGQPLPGNVSEALGAHDYAKQVDVILSRIAAGDVYEANLTQRMTLPFEGDPWTVHRALRTANPAPFAAYLELPEGCLVGSSPERFLRLDADGRVESRPINGTRPRGADARRDAGLREALATSVKDRAENLMIVDLVRNDLGRVCEVGSIHVPELMAVEAYASVFQLVSTVRGRLREDCDLADLLRATFPPGSMTGAPKIAAMKILAAIEPTRRGVYSGALGYFDVRGGVDLAVVIRTILLSKEHAHIHVGGAVVADSQGPLEYEEALQKARALLAALERAGRR